MRDPMAADAILCDFARASIRDRKLPNRNPACIWDAPGSGATYPVCGVPVTGEKKELVLEFAREDDTGLDTLDVHVRCFMPWATERERRYWS